MSISKIKSIEFMNLDCLCNVMSFALIRDWPSMFLSFKGLFEYVNSDQHTVCKDRVFKILNELKEDEMKTELSYLELLKSIEVFNNFMIIFFNKFKKTDKKDDEDYKLHCRYGSCRRVLHNEARSLFVKFGFKEIDTNWSPDKKRETIRDNLRLFIEKCHLYNNLTWYYFTEKNRWPPSKNVSAWDYEDLTNTRIFRKKGTINRNIKKSIVKMVNVCVKDASLIVLLNKIFSKCAKSIDTDVKTESLYDSAMRGVLLSLFIQGNGEQEKMMQMVFNKILKNLKRDGKETYKRDLFLKDSLDSCLIGESLNCLKTVLTKIQVPNEPLKDKIYDIYLITNSLKIFNLGCLKINDFFFNNSHVLFLVAPFVENE